MESVPIATLSQDPANARKHDDKNLEAIKASLRRFGQQKPIVVDSSNVVRAGNGTLAAATALGWDSINVVQTDLQGSEATAYAIADNRTAELAEWDESVLAASLSSLADVDETWLSDLQFSEKELAELVASTQEQEIIEDEVPDLTTDPVTQTGDLWILGEHRLLCGDSTNKKDVSRLMKGEKAVLMNTDPPYGVSYANNERPNPGVAKPRVAKPRVANDELTDEKLQKFLENCFQCAVELALKKNAAWYMWHAHLTQGYFAAAAAAAAADVVLHRQIIWVKPVLLLGRGQYHWKHEPCFMGWVKGNQPPDFGEGAGERTQTTVWEIGNVTQKERKELNHATPKPVEIFAIPIVKHTTKGEVCYEPFCGSGPQIIAAEQLDRKCYGMEISRQYCDVIVERWEKLTGKKARLEGGGSTS